MALRSLAGRAAVVFRLRCAPSSLAFSSHSPFSTAVVLDDLKYAKTHEWVRVEGDCGVVGITHHAQEELGDVVFVDLPEVGRQVAKGESFGVVESVKAASDIYSPISGEVVAVNSELADSPALVNKGPFDEGWIMKVKLEDNEEVCSLLGAEKYRQLLGVSTH
ncbi:unnamed protein product [Sphagnum jensenii]|uniref:Glycine cleavage system H protein n=1 Tax=Sphagnum jensenii TaxID=128206 RepID=A0ABP0WLK8_9BRYO